jgi:hypothetical protein
MVTNSDFKGCQTTLEELCEGITADGKYSHMQVFLHRNFKCQIGSKFLMVSPTVFGLVVVRDLTYENGNVIVEFLDYVTKQVGNVRIDINDERPRVLFICFEDIKSIVLTDCKKVVDDSGLLEFEY